MQFPPPQHFSPPAPAKPQKKPNVLLIIFGVIGLGVGLGFANIGLSKGGFLTTTDVGALAELAPTQAQLAPLDACEIEYAGRDKRGNRKHLDSIFVTTCSSGTSNTVVIKVPQRSGVGYHMKRSSPAKPFAIMVEKNEVVFQDLLDALAVHTPLVAAQFGDTLQKNRTMMAEHYRNSDAQRKAEQDRKSRAKESYPTK